MPPWRSRFGATRAVLDRKARSDGSAWSTIDHYMGRLLPVADWIPLELGRVLRIVDRRELSVDELQDLVVARHV
jgi:hypothetical protein